MSSKKEYEKTKEHYIEILKDTNLSYEEKFEKLNLIELIEKTEIYQTELEAQNEELIQKELELVSEKLRFQNLFNLAPIGFIEIDKKLNISYFNNEAVNILNTTPNEIKNLKSFFAYIHKDSKILFLKLLDKSKETEISSRELKLNFNNKSIDVLIHVRKKVSSSDEYLISISDLSNDIKQKEMLQETTTKLYQEITQKVDNYEKTILSLVELIEQRDFYTGGHSHRVSNYVVKIARALDLNSQDILMLKQIGLLHDIGKVIIPDSILLKPGKYAELERAIIQEHVTAGYNIISKIPMFKDFADAILYHHERYDGSGYPKGLKGEEIPLYAAILSIADTFDAMTTSRIYNTRKTVDEAIGEIKKNSGILFSPRIVKVATDVLKKEHTLAKGNQLPRNKIEEERFAYFFKDSLTGLYNENYLDIKLKDKKYISSLELVYFTEYNKNYGWEDGNIFLISFSRFLRQKYSKSLIFRVQGDGFSILSDTPLNITKEDIFQFESFKNSGIDLEIENKVLKEA